MKLCIVLLLFAACSASKKAGRHPKIDTSDVLNPDPNSNGPSKAEYTLGKDITEGDMLGAKKGASKDRNAVAEVYKLWPQATVPYTVHSSINTADRKEVMKQAIADFNEFTCVKFVPRNGEEDYAEFTAAGGGCMAWLGRSGGRQPINLGNGCWEKGTAIHEMLHTLGFAHEQSRGDRDKYINIHYENVIEGAKSQFDKMVDEENNMGFPYDFSSVMHYGAYGFTTDWSKPTITTKDPANQNKIGNRAGFSKQDVKEVNRLYKCNGKNSGIGGAYGCLDKDRNYCENVIGLKNQANPECSDSIKDYCRVSCKVCDPNGGGGKPNGPRPTPAPGPKPGNCKDQDDHYCRETLGLKNGPNHACKSEPHAKYCSKSCKKC